MECVTIKGKKVIEKLGSKILIKNENPSDLMDIHKETSEALSHTMDDKEGKKTRLKQRIVELKVDLNLCPLFTKPISIVHPVEDSPG